MPPRLPIRGILRSCINCESNLRYLLRQQKQQLFVGGAVRSSSTSPAPPKPHTPLPTPTPKPRLPPVDHVATSEKEFRASRPPQLVRPIGLMSPPQPGENSGVDTRSWQQRRDDFVDYEKHLLKRQRLSNEMATPYFRDFSRLSKQFKGKSWFAPPLLFKADKALFFPNLMGRTLNESRRLDTTHTLYGRVSVVTVFSSVWAENQVKSFVDGLEKDVPALTVEGGEKAQRVDINIEENWLKALVVKMFIPRLQARLPLEQHDRYFLVTKGVSQDLRHDMGLWNRRVGYVYLVDWNCRIRWAGSGIAEPEERAALVRGLKKLTEDHQRPRLADEE